MADFSLRAQRGPAQIQKWVHDFAEDVVRPAADEWDEREEFPWPIVEEAAKIGLYGFDFMASAHRRPHRPHPAGRDGGAVLGRRRHRPGDLRLGPRRRRHRRQRHARAVIEWVPQCYGTADDVQLGAFCVSEPDAGSDVGVAAHPGRLRRGQGRVGAQRHQGVDHQRRHRRRPRGGRRRSTPSSRAAGQASFVVPPGTPGPVAGPEVQEARHPGLAHRRGRARRRAGPRVAACSAARTSSTRSWPGPARPASSSGEKQPAMATFEATRPAVGAPGASASPAPPTSTRSSTPRSARRSASRSS